MVALAGRHAKLRVGLEARADRDGATRMEATANRNLDWIGRLSPQDLELGPMSRIPSRDDGEQRLRIRVQRPFDDISRGALLDDATEVHDADAIGACLETDPELRLPAGEREHRAACILV